MKSYRIYIVNQDGRLQLGQAFDAPDDPAAIERAAGLGGKGQTAELWQGGRLVGRISETGGFHPDGEA